MHSTEGIMNDVLTTMPLKLQQSSLSNLNGTNGRSDNQKCWTVWKNNEKVE
jgi:hypothetical protein